MTERSRGNIISKSVVYGSYPLIITLGFVLFFAFTEASLPVSMRSYLSALICAVFIFGHETYFPHRREWKPSTNEVRTDLTFLTIIQIGLPLLISLIITPTLTRLLTIRGVTDSIWPHHFPVWAQVILMLLISDFLRYWLHRAFHKYTPMWRFHAVHHSPHRLYWLNVGRFHPIEKTVQYLFDALPFVLIAVSTEVLAAYLVFYAVNGFYQHSNCEVRLGPLNYIVSGPELHRWHHSELIEESDNNYGNNLIIWDILFRTRFLPKDREVGTLGLINRNYPTGFVEQMKTPFIKGLDK